MRPLADFRCQNNDCPLFGKKNAGNISQRGWSGKNKRIRLLYCSACKAHFSERKGTALSGIRLTDEKAKAVFAHLAEQNGVRQTARLVGVDKNTVMALARKAGEHAAKVHDELVAFSPEHPGTPTRRKVVVRPKKRSAARTRRP